MISRTRATRSNRAHRFSPNFRAVTTLSPCERRDLGSTQYAREKRLTEQILGKLIELQKLELRIKGVRNRKPKKKPVLEHYDYQRSRGGWLLPQPKVTFVALAFWRCRSDSRSVLRAKSGLYLCAYCAAYLYLDEHTATHSDARKCLPQRPLTRKPHVLTEAKHRLRLDSS